MYLSSYLISFAILCCKASDYKFSLTRSKDWQSPGRLVQYTLKVVIPESSPIKTKIKLPFNNTAILRLTKAEIAEVSPKLSYILNSSSMTSSAGDDLKDIAIFDLGEVTRAPTDNETAIKFEFEVQVLNHQRIVNGEMQMVSVGAEYKNNSIWVAQLALKTVLPSNSRPDLSGQFWPVVNYHGVLTSQQISLRVMVKHSPQTSAEVDGGVIEWPKVSFLEYDSIVVYNDSVAVNAIDTPKAVSFKFGSLGFAQQVNFEFKVNLDPRKEMADGKIHDCATYLNVKFNGSVDACTSSPGYREFSHLVSTHFKFYVPQSCDEPLGMDSNTITDSQITASSYSSDGQPHQARLNGPKAWIPSGALSNDKSQFLQVNFTRKVKIRRISTRGNGEGFSGDKFDFVNRFSIFYSDDSVIWKPYKEDSKIKEFVGNSNNLFSQTIVLPIPIEAVFIRINPTGWNNNISLRVEFYGCLLNQNPSDSGLLKFTSRAYLLDKENDKMFVCSVPMKIKNDVSKCYFSSNKGVTWSAMDNLVLTLLGLDNSDGVLYGVGLNGKAVLRSSLDHAAKFIGVPLYAWENATMKASTVLATMLGSHVAITDDPSSVIPQSEHTVTASNGTEWGVSAKGVHVKESSTWKLKAVWMCSGL